MGKDATMLVPVSEYLSTVYEPDVDYVDGVLEDRNGGELDHSDLQGAVLAFLRGMRLFWVGPELRIKVSPTRFRVPDVCVYAEKPLEQVPSTAPLLVVEILSPEDRLGQMQVRLDDYMSMGCPCVSVIDPQVKRMYVYDGTSLTSVEMLTHPAQTALRLSWDQLR